jgi:hypothetical protein
VSIGAAIGLPYFIAAAIGDAKLKALDPMALVPFGRASRAGSRL